MSKEQIKILMALVVFLLCFVAPAIVGLLFLGLIAYMVSDIVVEFVFGGKDDEF